MANGDNPFSLSEMMTQGLEQTRKATESYLEFFEKNIKTTPWLGSDLNKNENFYGAKYCRCF